MRISKTDLVIFIMMVALLVYVSLRVVWLDVTNDEAYSFYIMKNFWYAEALCTGNTHWLNSLAIKSALFFGFESPWQIRWFSLLACMVFFTLMFFWLRSLKEESTKFLGFTVLLCNPYLLDYFGLGRGYAPGLMFQLLAFYLFIFPSKKRGSLKLFLSLFCAGVTPFCNFSFIYFFVAFSAIYFSTVHFKRSLGLFSQPSFYRDSLFIMLVSGLFFRAFIFMTTCSNDVVGAGTSNFLDFFKIFHEGFLYNKFKPGPEASNLISWCLCGFILVSCLYGAFSDNSRKNKIYFYTSHTLLIMLSAIFINFFCFDLVLPYYRSALFLFPAVGLCSVYFLNSILKAGWLKNTAFVSIGLLLANNFIGRINFDSTLDYHAQSEVKTSFDHLALLKAKHVGMSSGLYGVFRNYYSISSDYAYPFSAEQITTTDNKKPSRPNDELKRYDYVLLLPPYNLSYYKNSKISLSAVKWFNETGSVILKVDYAKN